MLLYRLLFAAVVLGLLCVGSGCASITIQGDAVTIKPGLRNLAVCFDEGKLESVIAYKQSRTFAGQNVVLGAAVGGMLGGPVGAGAGGIMGLASEIIDAAAALGDPDPTPTCEAPLAPPLRPDEVPVSAVPPPVPRPKTPRPFPTEDTIALGAQWNQFMCGGVMEPSWCR